MVYPITPREEISDEELLQERDNALERLRQILNEIEERGLTNYIGDLFK